MKTGLITLAKIGTFWPEQANISLPEDNLKDKKRYSLLFVLFFAFTAGTGALFLKNDLWQDELYTLDHFVLVPVSTTINDYHSTNNHILFNLIANLYLRLIGIKTLNELLENPILIRILPYTFTLLSVPVFYYGIKKTQGPFFALITLSIFISSIQLYTFGAQVRGYSLDILLCILLVNLILSFHQHSRNNLLPLITLTGTLLLINLPTTIYFILSLIVLTLLSNSFFLKTNNCKSFIASSNFKLAVALCLAVLLTSLFFFFKMAQITENPLLKASGNSLLKLVKQPLSVMYRLLDWRLILIVPILLVTLRLIPGIKVKASVFLLGSLFLPFVFCSFHNTVIVLRIWIILLPVFCLLLAQYFHVLISFRKDLLVHWVILLMLGTLSSLVFLKGQTFRNHSRSYAALDLRYQYHLFGFNPKQVTKKAKEYTTKQGAQIILLDHSLGGISYYLKFYDTPQTNSTTTPGVGKLFLISDGSREYERMVIPPHSIIDSGTQNNQTFYKWYLLKVTQD